MVELGFSLGTRALTDLTAVYALTVTMSDSIGRRVCWMCVGCGEMTFAFASRPPAFARLDLRSLRAERIASLLSYRSCFVVWKISERKAVEVSTAPPRSILRIFPAKFAFFSWFIVLCMR